MPNNEQTKAYQAANGGDLYKQHILPVVPYGIRGVLWDRGESGTAIKDLEQFTTMGALIGGWRDVWGQGEFPLLYVQKPSGGGCAWDQSGKDGKYHWAQAVIDGDSVVVSSARVPMPVAVQFAGTRARPGPTCSTRADCRLWFSAPANDRPGILLTIGH